jgi:hypothetical protein
MFTFATSAWRGKNDTGTGANTTDWIAAQNTGWSQDVDVNFRVRFRGGDTAGAAGTWTTPQLQYQLTPSGGSPGGFNNVTGSSSVVRATASPNVANDAATTTQLTGGGGGTFVAGSFDEVDGAVGSISLGASGNSEVEFCIQIRSGDVANNDTVELLVLHNGAAPTETNGHPSLTVVEAAIDVTGTADVVLPVLAADVAGHVDVGPSRQFDGTDDFIRLGSVSGLSGLGAGPFTIAAVVNRDPADTTGTVFWVCEAATPGTSRLNIVAVATEYRIVIDAATQGFGSAGAPVTGVWLFIAVTKATGTVAARIHIYNYSTGTWHHSNANNTQVDAARAYDSVQLGGSTGNFQNGKVAAAGSWSTALSDATIEGLELSLQSWADSGADAIWALNQASAATSVVDLIGNADQTALTGSTVADDGPQPFDFAVTQGIEGTADVVLPILAADATGAVDVEGTAAAVLPALDASLAGTVETPGITGTADVVLPAMSATAAGTLDVEGVATTTLPALGADATGDVTVTGTSASVLPALAVSVAGTVEVSGVAGTVDATLPALSATLAGELDITGTVPASLPALASTAAGEVAVDGTATVVLPTLGASLDGTVDTSGVTGTLIAALPALSAMAAGALDVEGTTVAVLPALVVSLTGTAPITADLYPMHFAYVETARHGTYNQFSHIVHQEEP